ncbi:hypothetical protein HY523_00410 [Candidatus Berkelbacteria bacterium]|nr:hypothetical protein [Candidatus Berkelbacteria bacterium]
MQIFIPNPFSGGWYVLGIETQEPPPEYFADIDDTHLPGEPDPLVWGAIAFPLVILVGSALGYFVL